MKRLWLLELQRNWGVEKLEYREGRSIKTELEKTLSHTDQFINKFLKIDITGEWISNVNIPVTRPQTMKNQGIDILIEWLQLINKEKERPQCYQGKERWIRNTFSVFTPRKWYILLLQSWLSIIVIYITNKHLICTNCKVYYIILII